MVQRQREERLRAGDRGIRGQAHPGRDAAGAARCRAGKLRLHGGLAAEFQRTAKASLRPLRIAGTIFPEVDFGICHTVRHGRGDIPCPFVERPARVIQRMRHALDGNLRGETLEFLVAIAHVGSAGLCKAPRLFFTQHRARLPAAGSALVPGLHLDRALQNEDLGDSALLGGHAEFRAEIHDLDGGIDHTEADGRRRHVRPQRAALKLRLPRRAQVESRGTGERDLRAGIECDLGKSRLEFETAATREIVAGRKGAADPFAILRAGKMRDRLRLLLGGPRLIRPEKRARNPDSEHHRSSGAERRGPARPSGKCDHIFRLRTLALHLASALEEARGHRHRADVKPARLLRSREHFAEPRALRAAGAFVHERADEFVQLHPFVVRHCVHAIASEVSAFVTQSCKSFRSRVSALYAATSERPVRFAASSTPDS